MKACIKLKNYRSILHSSPIQTLPDHQPLRSVTCFISPIEPSIKLSDIFLLPQCPCNLKGNADCKERSQSCSCNLPSQEYELY